MAVSRYPVALIAVVAACAGLGSAVGAQPVETSKPFASFSASATAVRDSVVAVARGQIGTRYKLGGTAPGRGLDCSGLVKYVMGALDVIMPRTARLQAKSGRAVPRDLASLKPGDLLTFGRGKSVSHIGIYVGDGRMIHASTTKHAVIETSLTRRSPLLKQWKGVRRLVESPRVSQRDSLLAAADTLR